MTTVFLVIDADQSEFRRQYRVFSEKARSRAIAAAVEAGLDVTAGINTAPGAMNLSMSSPEDLVGLIRLELEEEP